MFCAGRTTVFRNTKEAEAVSGGCDQHNVLHMRAPFGLAKLCPDALGCDVRVVSAKAQLCAGVAEAT